MENEIYRTVKTTLKNWWVPLVVGCLSIILGIWCLSTPISTFLALTMLFIIWFVVKGIFEIVFAISNRGYKDWGWSLAIGILDLVLGILLLANGYIAPAILIYYIIFWLMLQSFWGIGISIDLSGFKGSGWGWLLALAIIGLIFSSYLLFRPLVAGFFASFMFATAFIIYGIFRIFLSIKMKSLKNELEDIK